MSIVEEHLHFTLCVKEITGSCHLTERTFYFQESTFLALATQKATVCNTCFSINAASASH